MNDNALIEELVTCNLAALDTFLAVSRIYLGTTEDWAQLNIETMHDMVTDSTEAAAALANGESPLPAGTDLLNKALAYTSRCAEIATESQQQVNALIKPPSLPFDLGQSLQAMWSSVPTAKQKASGAKARVSR